MKNFYEMEQEDKNKKRKEFKETTFGKNAFWFRNLGLYVMLVIIFGVIFFGIVTDFIGETFEDLDLENTANVVFLLAFAEFIIFEIATRISFMRWLKIKYKIDY